MQSPAMNIISLVFAGSVLRNLRLQCADHFVIFLEQAEDVPTHIMSWAMENLV